MSNHLTSSLSPTTAMTDMTAISKMTPTSTTSIDYNVTDQSLARPTVTLKPSPRSSLRYTGNTTVSPTLVSEAPLDEVDDDFTLRSPSELSPTKFCKCLSSTVPRPSLRFRPRSFPLYDQDIEDLESLAVRSTHLSTNEVHTGKRSRDDVTPVSHRPTLRRKRLSFSLFEGNVTSSTKVYPKIDIPFAETPSENVFTFGLATPKPFYLSMSSTTPPRIQHFNHDIEYSHHSNDTLLLPML